MGCLVSTMISVLVLFDQVPIVTPSINEVRNFLAALFWFFFIWMRSADNSCSFPNSSSSWLKNVCFSDLLNFSAFNFFSKNDKSFLIGRATSSSPLNFRPSLFLPDSLQLLGGNFQWFGDMVISQILNANFSLVSFPKSVTCLENNLSRSACSFSKILSWPHTPVNCFPVSSVSFVSHRHYLCFGLHNLVEVS